MIITTIDKVKGILPTVSVNVLFQTFQTHVESAEDWLKLEILGDTLYDKIDSGTIIDEKLQRFVEKIIVLKAYELGIPFMDLVQTPNGFGIVNDKTHAPASRYRVDALVKQVGLLLSQQIEWLLNYLEDTATYHTDWKSSPAYSLLSDCLIRTQRELQRLIKFEGTRNDFLNVKPIMISISTLVLAPEISANYLEELIEKQNGGTLNAEDKKVLPLLKQSLANYLIEKDWFGKRLLDDAVTIMDKHLDSYPTYRDSEEKALKDDPGFENSEDNKIFVFKGGL